MGWCECIGTSLHDSLLLKKGLLTQSWKMVVFSNYFCFPYVTLWNIIIKYLSLADVGKLLNEKEKEKRR